MLKYFTYDNDDVLSKLSDLLCNSNPSFFIKDGLYKKIVDDDFIYKCSDEAKKTWDKFSLELKHERRFNHKEATSFYENLISLCKKKEEEITEYTALRKVSKGTVLYRARLVKDDDHLKSIFQNPLKELSAPPEKFAANSRMSPPGIAFMYTAGDHKTAVAEIHPYAGDKVAVASFTCTKDLNFFDFTLLDNVNYMEANILTAPIKNKFFQNGYFIRKLHELISKPYRATDVSYIETQVLAEVIRHHEGGLYDGIIFRSTQRENGMNYVVFGSRIESNDKASRKDYFLELEKKDPITIYNIKCIDIGMDK